VMLPELDVVNNKVCPYCNYQLLKYADGLYERYDCDECCVKVAYDKRDPYGWVWIKIVFVSENMNSKICEISFHRRVDSIKVVLEPPSDRIRDNDPNYTGIIELPIFNVFAYSKDELEKRLNRLIVFS